MKVIVDNACQRDPTIVKNCHCCGGLDRLLLPFLPDTPRPTLEASKGVAKQEGHGRRWTEPRIVQVKPLVVPTFVG